MDGPMIEVAYGETMIHSTEVVVVGVQLENNGWGVAMMYHSQHTRVNTNMAPYMIFSDFHDIKFYIYYVFKSICIIKRHIGDL